MPICIGLMCHCVPLSVLSYWSKVSLCPSECVSIGLMCHCVPLSVLIESLPNGCDSLRLLGRRLHFHFSLRPQLGSRHGLR